MLFIDEHTEAKLVEALQVLRAAPKTSRCLYFNLAGREQPADLKEKLFEFAQLHFAEVDAQLYLCEDGDVFVLASALAGKDGRAFILSMVDYLKRPADESWAGFYDAALDAGRLLVIAEEKLEKQRKEADAARKKAEQQQADRKRQSILNQTILADAATIKTRREARQMPEMMMIEDDVFSSKLVENVLQKKLAITCLKEATHALDTYTRIAPDLLFLDINLPNVTGHELLERILALDPNAYVVMLSGNADQKNIMQAMAKGAKGFIAKPFTREKLFQYIDRCPGITAKQCASSIH